MGVYQCAMTAAPALAKPSAIARPMPVLAPVTRTVWPSKLSVSITLTRFLNMGMVSNPAGRLS